MTLNCDPSPPASLPSLLSSPLLSDPLVCVGEGTARLLCFLGGGGRLLFIAGAQPRASRPLGVIVSERFCRSARSLNEVHPQLHLLLFFFNERPRLASNNTNRWFSSSSFSLFASCGKLLVDFLLPRRSLECLAGSFYWRRVLVTGSQWRSLLFLSAPLSVPNSTPNSASSPIPKRSCRWFT